MLTLPEELVLLALDTESGAVSSCGSRLSYALAGGVLAELLLGGHIRINDNRVEAAVVPDAGCLAAVAYEHILREPGRSLKHWVERLAAKLHIREQALAALGARGILHDEDRHFLVFHYHRYPLDQVQIREELRQRLRGALLVNESPRDKALAALAEPCGLLRRAFGHEEWHEHKKAAADMARSWPISAAVLKVAEEMDAAIVAATVGMYG
jgi:hypothetical protein